MNFFSAVCKAESVLHLLAGCLQNLAQSVCGFLPTHLAELRVCLLRQGIVAALRHLSVIVPHQLSAPNRNRILIAVDIL